MGVRKARKAHELRVAAFAIVCGAYASSASALEHNGFQYIVNFDELPIGATEISYDTPGPLVFMIMGGEVISGNPKFPAHSAPNVYFSAGGAISTSSSLGLITNWPVIAAWVTPTTAPVTATFTGYNNFLLGPITETVTTVGFTPDQFLGVTDPHNIRGTTFSPCLFHPTRLSPLMT